MWEISVSIDKDNLSLLPPIQSKLCAALKGENGIVAIDNDDTRAYLLLACEESNRELLKKILTEEIIRIYIDDFKQEYLLKNARLPMNNPINYNAFIRALVAFDSEFDKEIVENKLTVEDGLNLDGFFHFKLKELKSRWKEVCDLANDNACYLGYQDTFAELMRFLVSTIEPRASEIIIEECEGGYNVFDCDKLVRTVANNETLLSTVINFSPSIINVYENNAIPANIMEMLLMLYEKRIKTIYMV